MNDEHTGPLHRDVRAAYADPQAPPGVTLYEKPFSGLDLTHGITCPHATAEERIDGAAFADLAFGHPGNAYAITQRREDFCIALLIHFRANHGCDCPVPEAIERRIRDWQEGAEREVGGRA